MNNQIATSIAESVYGARGGKSIAEHQAIAAEKIGDDDIVAFGLVAIRKGADGQYQSATHRAIDVEAVLEADADGEELIDDLHEAMCREFDEKVAQR